MTTQKPPRDPNTTTQLDDAPAAKPAHKPAKAKSLKPAKKAKKYFG